MKLFSLLFTISILTVDIGNCEDGVLPKEFWDKFYTQVKSTAKWLFYIKNNVPIHEDVKFHLYTKASPHNDVLIQSGDFYMLSHSSFNPKHKTTFVIHGWIDHKDRGTIKDLRKELLKHIDTNVIVVDWRRLAGQVYFHAAPSAKLVGEHLAEFLKFLQKGTNITYDSIHLIGHSLGGQISGIAGGLLGGKIGRITGLDPAGPMYEFLYVDKPKDDLDPSDAQFVDIIHSAAEDFGVNEAIGHVDFYPNDGIVPQPGCSKPIAAISCSHVRSVEFMTESINGTIEFLARPCSSWVERVLGHCDHNEPIVPMGYHTPTSARGTYYLKTSAIPPFALGMDGI